MTSQARHAVGGAERTHSGPDIWCEDLVRIHTTEGVEVQALQGLSLTVDQAHQVGQAEERRRRPRVQVRPDRLQAQGLPGHPRRSQGLPSGPALTCFATAWWF